MKSVAVVQYLGILSTLLRIIPVLKGICVYLLAIFLQLIESRIQLSLVGHTVLLVPSQLQDHVLLAFDYVLVRFHQLICGQVLQRQSVWDGML